MFGMWSDEEEEELINIFLAYYDSIEHFNVKKSQYRETFFSLSPK